MTLFSTTHRRRLVPASRRSRTAIFSALSAAMVAPALAVAGPADALNPAGVGPNDPSQRGFPAYYTDDSGVALQLCDDGTAACLATGPAELAPPDGEGFYWMATTSLSSPGLSLDIEFAAEAAWLTRTQAITFDRLRIRGHSDAAGDIPVTTPYGVFTVTAGDPAAARNVNFTEDVGCTPTPACDFTAMTTSASSHITNWIRNTPVGSPRLGDGVTAAPSTMGGAPATASAGGDSTDSWTVVGKVADPRAVSLPAASSFGNVRGTRTKAVRLLNLGTQPLTISGATLTGSPTLTALPTSTCTAGRVVGVGGGCRVVVRYRPDGRKRSGATLNIADDAGGHSVKVNALTAAVAKAPRQVTMRSVRARTTGGKKRIVVTNTGSIPMKVKGVSIGGRHPGSFQLRSGAPKVCTRGATIRPGKQCGVYVAFTPNRFGPKQAVLTLRSNSLGGPRKIALSGRAL